jgi:redox-sensitive bicupin YhaK (pirin superfamily)
VIVVRRAKDRSHRRQSKREAWQSFFPHDPNTALADGFGVLVILDETRAAPSAGVSASLDRAAEVITYVLEGVIAYQDPAGSTGVVRAGEFRRMTTAHRIRYREANASADDWVHVFHVGLRASPGARLAPGEQRRFTLAERQGVLCTIASPDGRSSSLRVHEGALLFSCVLERGQHVAHELLPGRRAWVHVVHGEVKLGDVVLTTGDGAGVMEERVVSLTARAASELLLVDVGSDAPAPFMPREAR